MFILFLKMQTLYKNKLYKAFCNIMLLHQIASKQTVDYQEREQSTSAYLWCPMLPFPANCPLLLCWDYEKKSC